MKLLRVFILLQLLLLHSCNIVDFDDPSVDIITVPNDNLAGEFLNDWAYSVNPGLADNFDVAQFGLWVPDDTSNLRALLILLHGANTSALGFENNQDWQDYANEENIGLIGVSFKGGGYTDPIGGSGKALLTALDSITKRNNIPEVYNLPFIMRGFSAGGVFSYYFSHWKPERVVAFVNIRGGGISIDTPENKHIPGLMLIGENDAPTRGERMINAVKANRAIGGVWGYAIEPNAEHFTSLDASNFLAKKFFSAVLDLRVSNGTNELNDIPENSGWLGNNETKDIFYFGDYPDNPAEATWLANELFGNYWQEYQE